MCRWGFNALFSSWWVICLKTQQLLSKFLVILKMFVLTVNENQPHEGSWFTKVSHVLCQRKASGLRRLCVFYWLSSVPWTFRSCLLKCKGCVGLQKELLIKCAFKVHQNSAASLHLLVSTEAVGPALEKWKTNMPLYCKLKNVRVKL